MQDWLVEALRERMKYFRCKKVFSIQHQKVKQQCKKTSTLLHAIDSIGEDEAFHDRHTKLLVLEWRKCKLNRHAV